MFYLVFDSRVEDGVVFNISEVFGTTPLHVF
jgi:hypothetical protein